MSEALPKGRRGWGLCSLLHAVWILEHRNRGHHLATTFVVANLTQLVDKILEELFRGVRWHLGQRIRDPGSIVMHAGLSEGKKQNKRLVESPLKLAQWHELRCAGSC